jgi:large conductance mechanosensitive channel
LSSFQAIRLGAATSALAPLNAIAMMRPEKQTNPMKDLHLDNGAKKATGMLKEFKEFAMRGNVVDLAVGVVIGAAFGKIVTSMVSDVITPVIGFVTPGGADLKEKYFSLQPLKTMGTNNVIMPLAEAQKHGAVIAYGSFLGAVVDFVIVAFCIFIVVKLINKLHAPPPPPPPPEATAQEKLLVEIRDLLKTRT